MKHPRDLEISDFTYVLPAERIAAYPLTERDSSKLLIYRNGEIGQSTYAQIANFLPEKSLVVFNDTRVIPARILFTKPTGGTIEIFCLEPWGMQKDYASVMSDTASSAWKAMIGGAAKWKSGPLLKVITQQDRTIELSVRLVEKLEDAYVAEFSWQPAELSFAEIIHAAGAMPLPPYIKRKPEEEDAERYQTVYANYEGSVAAPTAGLHFTDKVLEQLEEKNISKLFLTLHVGAGTFKPVKAEKMEGHLMHAEWIDVDKDAIKHLASHAGPVTAVGTTATRTLETLFWMGVKAGLDPQISKEKIMLRQWEVYDGLDHSQLSREEAMNNLLSWMETKKEERIFCQTELLIAPGYTFRMTDILVTNFHQPGSTLLLLVAAATAQDWKRIYNYALANDFRFLSYGDGSMIFISPE